MTVYAISLCFNRPDVIRSGLSAYYKTKNPALEVVHALVDQHYPLPDKETIHREVKAIAREFNCIYLDPGKNLGLHHGFNWACKQLKVKSDDIVIGYDPDSNPVSPGWDMALITVLSQPEIVWASLMNPRTEADIKAKGYTEQWVNGHIRIWITKHAVINSVCAWRYSFIEKAGGLDEHSKFYGGLEVTMWPHLARQGKKWALLPDWRETDDIVYTVDWQYKHYKWFHGFRRKWDGDFESYLAAGCPDLDK